jgi:hypothetical protein
MIKTQLVSQKMEVAVITKSISRKNDFAVNAYNPFGFSKRIRNRKILSKFKEVS